MISISSVKKIKIITKNAEGKEEIKYDGKLETFYSHPSWLEEENIIEINKIRNRQMHERRCGCVLSGIGALIATIRIPSLYKLSLQKRIVGILGVSILGYALTSFVTSNTANIKIGKIINEKDLIPLWNSKDKVVEKQNMYFFLDDDKGFAPNILYPGISQKQIYNLLPDAIHGNINIKKYFFNKFNHLIQNKDFNQTKNVSFSKKNLNQHTVQN